MEGRGSIEREEKGGEGVGRGEREYREGRERRGGSRWRGEGV